MDDPLHQLSEFLCGMRFEELPKTVRQRAIQVSADTLAAIAGGSAEPEMQALTDDLLRGSSDGASVVGTGRRGEAGIAAFLNGTAGTFLELDEGNQFARGHPGIHVVPAALACCETRASSGRDFLLAVTLGYEVGTRIAIGSALRPSIHPHGTWGTVAAAVTVAKLAGASAAQIREVINVASPLGLANSDQTMLEGGTVRNTFAGFSAQTGLMVWNLVCSGFSGEHDGLSTVWGKVLSDSWQPLALIDELGERWEITRNYFKHHACCRYNHAALDVLTKLHTEHKFTAEMVRSIEVQTYSLAARLCDQTPKNTLAAKFSLPFSIATTIVHGSSGMQSFTWDAICNNNVIDLAARVVVSEDPGMTAMLPARRPARLTITLNSNEKLVGYTETNRGDSGDPYQQHELTKKFFELTERVWPRDVAQSFFDGVMNLEDVADMNDLTPGA